MALHWKLVIDARDAGQLALFWAAALEYVVENPEPLIQQLIEAGQLPEGATVGAPGSRRFRGYSAIRHPDDPHDALSGVGSGRRILFQDVPETKAVKNRLHIDVHAANTSLEAHVARLEALGARRLTEMDQGPAGHWWVLADPEGNEFCAAG
ncbi:VOC family protein [Leucobacter sp. NPDC058333]|uniref:VOC family protein n=1 Tax=Leucobacter sp. NPDC058333 TaxID=3346450 RepID=UPI00366707DC